VPTFAFTVADMSVAVGVDESVKLTLVEPLGTVTDVGAVSQELDRLIATITPDEPAADDRVTAAVTLSPPMIELGIDNELTDWPKAAAMQPKQRHRHKRNLIFGPTMQAF